MRYALLPVGIFFLGLMFSFQTPIATEYKIKAVFLYNFTQFVTFPSYPEKDQIVLGIIGEDPFGVYLDETVTGEQINGRTLKVERYTSIKDIGDCDILFINQKDVNELNKIMNQLGQKPILTVGDSRNFIRAGGMVRFVKQANKIRFQINLDKVQSANLIISSKLLRLAEIIKTEDDQ